MELIRKIRNAFSTKANNGGIFAPVTTATSTAPWYNNPGAQIEQYRQWVYVAVRAIATRVASTNLNFIDEETSSRLEPSHPLRQLFREVNPHDTSVTLWTKTMMFLELTGNAYWYLPKNALGEIAEIWVIPSHYMRVIPDAEKFIAGYEYSCAGVRETFDTDEIVHLKYPSPDSVYYGTGPLQAAADSVEAHKAMKKAERKSFEHGAFPGLAIQTEEKLAPTVRARLEKAFENGFSGANKAGRTLILEQGLKVRPFTMSPREMDFMQSSKMTRDEILAVFGVPAAVAGISEDVNRASAEAMLYTFAENTILPKLRLIQAQITQDICSKYPGVIEAKFENPIPAVRSEERADMELRLKYGITTPEEERERLQW